MNELSAADKALVVNALLRLVGEDVLTVLEKRDIIHEITNLLTGFNITDIVNDTTNRRRLLLKGLAADEEYTGLPRELVFDPATKTIKIFGETTADDTIIGAAPDIDIEELLTDMDYVIDSGETDGVWWRKYKSGWVEQGGKLATTYTGTGNKSMLITLPISMTDSGFTCMTSFASTFGGFADATPFCYGTDADTVRVGFYANSSVSSPNYQNWIIRGQAATAN